MLWLKFLHLLAAFAWLAGLLYLPRLFVHHADCEDEPGRRRFAIMEKRLYWRIMTPAMALNLLFGTWLLAQSGARGGWLGAKIALLAALVVFHLSCAWHMRRLAGDGAASAGFFRLYNEIPTLLLAGILFFAVLKPF